MRFLHAERDPMYASIFRRLLQSAGHESTHISRGDHVVEVAHREKPDAIVLGLCLDPSDGFEVLQALREDAACASLPVVVLSHMGSREDVERCLALGADGYLVKQHHDAGELVRQVCHIASTTV